MKKIFTLFIFVSLLTGNHSFASHAMGGDITYRCLGPDSIPGSYKYEITFSFYRDCSGIAAPPSMDINVDNTCGFPQQTVFINSLPSSPTQISPICSTDTTRCNGGAYIGIQEWVYQGIISIPGQCAGWTFYHSESARNAAITTITGNGTDNLFVYSTMNNLNGICDNSPVFSNKPVAFPCVGQLFCFNHGTYDIDGDSLSYQIITPRTGPLPVDTVIYRPGYSATQPVISTIQPMTFDAHTGDFCLFPTQADVTVMAVLVSEYRNGILIGQVERDIQLTINYCNNNLPSLTGFNGLHLYNQTVCRNQQNCFIIRSIDPDTGNTTSIMWDNSIPNASFTTSGGHRDTAFFCWTPTALDSSSNPYCFTAEVYDDNCPYNGLQVYSYCLTIDTSPGCVPLSLSVGSLINNNSGLKIFPQPATDHLFIDFGNDFTIKNHYQLRIVNVFGETVYIEIMKEQIQAIDVRKFSTTGIYFAYVTDETGRVIKSEKLIITK